MYAVKSPPTGQVRSLFGGSVLEEGREAPERVPEYTVIGVLNDGTELNQAVKLSDRRGPSHFADEWTPLKTPISAR